MSKFQYGLILTALVAVACSSQTEEKSGKEKQNLRNDQSTNEYPDLTLTLIGGDSVLARTFRGNNILIFFQPDCRHCQIEAMNIEQRLDAFTDYRLYFISSSSLDAIQAFAESFDLDDKENVKFGWASTQSVLDHYGPIQTPSLYIYSNGKLKQAFNGQTEIEDIINAL